jgi:hypothetical protein
MYSVKPGRGPSLMGGIGGVVVGLLGVVWTFSAVSMGAPPFFALFGVVFIVMALVGAAYNFYNAANPDRMSTFDITSGGEELDPIAKALGHVGPSAEEREEPSDGPRKYPGDHCPFCGAAVAGDFDFCPKCGKDI